MKLCFLVLALVFLPEGRGGFFTKFMNRGRSESDYVDDDIGNSCESVRILPRIALAVVGGNPLKNENSAPYITAIGERLSNGSVSWFCGGSLVSAHDVLTAAHCLVSRNVTTVRVGSFSTKKRSTENDYEISETIIHPGYKITESYNDIAIIKVKNKISFSKNIKPVCLPQDEKMRYEGERAKVIGWGAEEFGGEGTQKLQQVEVEVFTNSNCEKAYSNSTIAPKTFPKGIRNEQLCAGSKKGGKDACQGDSGGPLVLTDKSGIVRQIGIVSTGAGCGFKMYPGVYVRVSSYTNWIQKQINQPKSKGKPQQNTQNTQKGNERASDTPNGNFGLNSKPSNNRPEPNYSNANKRPGNEQYYGKNSDKRPSKKEQSLKYKQPYSQGGFPYNGQSSEIRETTNVGSTYIGYNEMQEPTNLYNNHFGYNERRDDNPSNQFQPARNNQLPKHWSTGLRGPSFQKQPNEEVQEYVESSSVYHQTSGIKEFEENKRQDELSNPMYEYIIKSPTYQQNVGQNNEEVHEYVGSSSAYQTSGIKGFGQNKREGRLSDPVHEYVAKSTINHQSAELEKPGNGSGIKEPVYEHIEKTSRYRPGWGEHLNGSRLQQPVNESVEHSFSYQNKGEKGKGQQEELDEEQLLAAIIADIEKSILYATVVQKKPEGEDKQNETQPSGIVTENREKSSQNEPKPELGPDLQGKQNENQETVTDTTTAVTDNSEARLNLEEQDESLSNGTTGESTERSTAAPEDLEFEKELEGRRNGSHPFNNENTEKSATLQGEETEQKLKENSSQSNDTLSENIAASTTTIENLELRTKLEEQKNESQIIEHENENTEKPSEHQQNVEVEQGYTKEQNESQSNGSMIENPVISTSTIKNLNLRTGLEEHENEEQQPQEPNNESTEKSTTPRNAETVQELTKEENVSQFNETESAKVTIAATENSEVGLKEQENENQPKDVNTEKFPDVQQVESEQVLQQQQKEGQSNVSVSDNVEATENAEISSAVEEQKETQSNGSLSDNVEITSKATENAEISSAVEEQKETQSNASAKGNVEISPAATENLEIRTELKEQNETKLNKSTSENVKMSTESSEITSGVEEQKNEGQSNEPKNEKTEKSFSLPDEKIEQELKKEESQSNDQVHASTESSVSQLDTESIHVVTVSTAEKHSESDREKAEHETRENKVINEANPQQKTSIDLPSQA